MHIDMRKIYSWVIIPLSSGINETLVKSSFNEDNLQKRLF